MTHLETLVVYIEVRVVRRETASPFKDSSRRMGPDSMQSNCCLGQVGSGCSITRTANAWRRLRTSLYG